ncbi:MAG TPA: helix-hairpin-helix domain-containing protein [Thermoplasmata archaeon]|nr:helix-hairpin-helix domain-containing protein [Thermoplasmata archaeon]
MKSNAAAAAAFQEIADLLDVLGEKFKPEAYRRAARSLESLTEDLAAVATRDQLRTIPGVGEAIEEKIREFLRDGTIPYLEKLRSEVPSGVVAMMRSPGLGPKTARKFWTDLGVDSPAALLQAIDAGRLEGVKGFGPTKIAKIRAGVAAAPTEGGRRPILAAALLAEEIVAKLRARSPVTQIELAGSFRRRRETVGDLDILVTSAEPERVMEAFGALEGATVVLRGPTKETIRTADGFQVDLRVLAPESFGAALQYFTGSKDHNVLTRSIARDKGLKINEYFVVHGEERLPSATEEEVYRAIDLPWIPPEIREARGEIEAARAGTLPTLLEPRDLVGEFHLHVAASETTKRLEEIAETGGRAGLRTIGLIPASEEELARLTEWAKGRAHPSVLVGWESPLGDPGPSGPILPAFHIGSARGLEPPSTPPRALPRPGWVGHFGSDPETPQGPDRLAGWVRWAASAHVPLEVTSSPGYDGLDAVSARRLVESGGSVVVSELGVGAERARALAVGTARRAWITKASVLNATTWPPGPGRTPRE